MTTHLEKDQAVASLAAFASLPDWLAAGMDGSRVSDSLAQYVPELVAGAFRVLSCTPERLRAKGGEWIARYKLSVAGPTGEARDMVLVGNLRAPTQEARAAVPGTNDLPFGEPGWACWLPALGLELRAQASDDALPAMARLVEPETAAELLQPILRDAGYRDATITSCDPVVVRYKPGSRCTVVVGLTYAEVPSGATPPSPVVLKTHQGDKGQSAWAAMNALWKSPHGWEGSLRLAEPIAYLPDERILVQGPVPEECTLKELARQAFLDGSAQLLDRLREELAKTARALAALHGSGVSYGRTATFEDELAEVRDVVDRLSLTIPQLDLAAGPLLTRLTRRAMEEYADPIVSAHHDFRPAQVLLHHGQIGFIDFDGACMAEPALDIGRFRAKLRDIGISTLAFTGQPLSGEPVAETLTLLDDLCEHFLAEYELHSPVSRERVVLWEACDLFTAVLHAWTKVRLARLAPRLVVLLHQLRGNDLA